MASLYEELDAIEHLNTLSGDAYFAEAKRLGFVVTEKGLFADPDHHARKRYSIEDMKTILEEQARRHGHVLDLDS